MSDYRLEDIKEMIEKQSLDQVSDDELFSIADNYYALRSVPWDVTDNLDAMVKILEYLCKKGYPPGCYRLGLLKYNGEVVKEDKKEAYTLHLAAAEKGYADAMFEVYAMLSTGEGVQKDEKKALEWGMKAAEAGQHRAAYSIGAHYASGKGVEKDLKKAIEWYEKASELGNGKASATLGVMCKKGEEVEKSDEKAEEYFKKAEMQHFNLEYFLISLQVKRT